MSRFEENTCERVQRYIWAVLYIHSFKQLKAIVQLNLNLTFTRMWHERFWTKFSCHSHVLHEQIIKIYIYTCVTLELLNKFIRSLVSCKQGLHLSGYSQIASDCCTNLLHHLRIACERMILCTRDVRYSLGMYHVMCKMHTWPQHFWIRLELYNTPRSLLSLLLLHQLQPVIFQYRPDCWLDPSTSAY